MAGRGGERIQTSEAGGALRVVLTGASVPERPYRALRTRLSLTDRSTRNLVYAPLAMIPPVVVVSYKALRSATFSTHTRTAAYGHGRAEPVELARDGRVLPMYRVEFALEVCPPRA